MIYKNYMKPVPGFVYSSYAYAKKRLNWHQLSLVYICSYVTAATAGSLGVRLALMMLLFFSYCYFVHILANSQPKKMDGHWIGVVENNNYTW
jgi:hypothetical protein